MNNNRNRYNRYSILVRGNREASFDSFFVDVVAISIEAAIADLEEAFVSPEIITWSAR
jgi:hypothetical protein